MSINGKGSDGDIIRRRTVVSVKQNHLRWFRIYVCVKEDLKHIKKERPKDYEIWQRYISQYPWARIVPFIISLTRWSHIDYLAIDVDQQPQEAGGSKESGDIRGDDIKWKNWAAKEELINTDKEVDSWWNELNMNSRIHYLMHMICMEDLQPINL